MADLKEQKTAEEIKRLKIQNAIASRDMVHKNELLSEITPVLSRIIDNVSTVADDLANDLAHSDAALCHTVLSNWAKEKFAAMARELNGTSTIGKN